MFSRFSVISLSNKFVHHSRIKQIHSSYCNSKFLSSSSTETPSEVTAGVLVIGDEILNGQAEDKNISFLINNLNLAGIKIKKVSIVPDDIDAIAKEVTSLSNNCSVVLTTGGIGPTHDDVTYEAVAKAFGEELIQNGELSKLYRNYFSPQVSQNPAVQKFSSIPESAVLNFHPHVQNSIYKFPLISVRNVFMLPGVPMLLHKGFEVFKSKFLFSNKPNIMEHIFLMLDEVSVTPVLNEAVDMFKGFVKFGSYPSFSENYYKLKITIEGSDKESVIKASNFLKSRLPQEKIVVIKKNVFESAIDDVPAICKEYASYSLSASIVQQALQAYGLSELCICFNGGKDCTALLHLVYSYVQKLKPNEWSKIVVFYVRNRETFPEIEDFIKTSTSNYNFNLIIMEGELKNAFIELCKSHPQIKAVLMGTRRCDPGAELLRYFIPTDEHWPPMMRILPILDWSYSDVWNFIRKLQLPYCKLYDRGYTSLGVKGQTFKNSALLVPGQNKFNSYKPAYMLYDGNEERNGRV